VSEALIAFAGVAVGGVIAVVGAWLRGRQEASLDREKRADNRRLDSDAFQLANLKELQEGLHDWMSIRAKKVPELKEMVAAGETDAFDAFDALIPADHELQTRLDLLTARVLNDPLRKSIEALRALASLDDHAMAEYPTMVTVESVERDWRRLSTMASETDQMLGSELRRFLSAERR
jgi:hypothetical protein